eukprot:6175969-Pleurochrysis_carterae.AAC.1
MVLNITRCLPESYIQKVLPKAKRGLQSGIGGLRLKGDENFAPRAAQTPKCISLRSSPLLPASPSPTNLARMEKNARERDLCPVSRPRLKVRAGHLTPPYCYQIAAPFVVHKRVTQWGCQPCLYQKIQIQPAPPLSPPQSAPVTCSARGSEAQGSVPEGPVPFPPPPIWTRGSEGDRGRELASTSSRVGGLRDPYQKLRVRRAHRPVGEPIRRVGVTSLERSASAPQVYMQCQCENGKLCSIHASDKMKCAQQRLRQLYDARGQKGNKRVSGPKREIICLDREIARISQYSQLRYWFQGQECM